SAVLDGCVGRADPVKRVLRARISDRAAEAVGAQEIGEPLWPQRRMAGEIEIGGECGEAEAPADEGVRDLAVRAGEREARGDGEPMQVYVGGRGGMAARVVSQDA